MIYELGNGQRDIPALRNLLEKTVPHRESFDDFEVSYRFESIGEKVMVLNPSQVVQRPGRSKLILLAIEDVTAQRKAQRKLEQPEARYHMLVEELNSIIISIDSHGATCSFNSFSEKLFGYSRDELLGKPLVGTIIPLIDSSGEDNTPLAEGLVADPGKYYGNESEGVSKDGRRVRFYWSAKAVRDASGAVLEILMDGNDITELAAARAELEEKSATLDTVLESVPEGIVITNTKLALQRVSRYTGELLSIPIEQMMHTDESGRLDRIELYEPGGARVAHPNDLPFSKAATVGREYHDHDLVLKRDGTTKVLSLNAAPIRDADNGIGFDHAIAEHVFEPFKRVHPEKQFAKAGPGLSTVPRAIKRHGGSVWAESETGKGAVFSFTLGQEPR